MQTLPNNCRAGKMSVFPGNWKNVNANRNLTWRISYRFYDDNLHQIKKVVIKGGMNTVDDLKEKQDIVKLLLSDEAEALKNGYNPILKSFKDEPDESDITPETPFIKALEYALKEIKCVRRFKNDIKSSIGFMAEAAIRLNFENIHIVDIKRKHIKRILASCATHKARWSANTYNSYRRNLSMLFSQLLEDEVVENNPIRDLAKEKTVRKLRRLLTPDECTRIDDFTKKYDRRFWLLINIFFHSGARTTEMFRVKCEHVDIINQMVKYTVLKGNQPFEVERPIKDIAVEYWIEAIQGAKQTDFIFAKGLKPHATPISERQATLRWRRHIKGKKELGKLGITCNWYDLKYLNTDQVSKEKGLKVAGLLNAHTNEGTTRLYAVNENQRMLEEIKQMGNAFVKTS